MKRVALLLISQLVAAPVAAQVATVPVQSLSQGLLTPDTALTISVTLFGYTTRSQVPHLLTSQTAKLVPISFLQREIRAEFPGFEKAGMTVMQLVVKTSAEAPTFHSTSETVTPKKPLAINVPAGKKLWVVYSAPAGQQANLRFYVDTPPAASPVVAGPISPPAPSVTPPAIGVKPGGVTFAFKAGGPLPSPIPLMVTVAGGGAWSTNDQSSFYDASLVCWSGAGKSCASGQSTTLTPSSGMAALAPGTHQSNITISSGSLPSVVVPVRVIVSR